jgi:hypothetical protein
MGEETAADTVVKTQNCLQIEKLIVIKREERKQRQQCSQSHMTDNKFDSAEHRIFLGI